MIQPREEKLLGNTYLLISYCVLGLGVEGVSLFSDLKGHGTYYEYRRSLEVGEDIYVIRSRKRQQ